MVPAATDGGEAVLATCSTISPVRVTEVTPRDLGGVLGVADRSKATV